MKRILSVFLILLMLIPAVNATAVVYRKVSITVTDSETGKGLQGVSVTLYSVKDNTQKYVKAQISDASGTTKFSVTDGKYKAVIKRSPFGYNSASDVSFSVASKDKAVAMKLTPKPGKISVKVTDSKTNKPAYVQLLIKDKNGRIVKAASVSHTNKNTGMVTFTSLKQGEYSIYLADDKYVQKLGKKVTLAPGRTESVTLSAVPTYAVKFKVKDRAGRAVKSPNVGVSVSRSGYTDRFARVDSNGVATVKNVPYGTATVKVCLYGVYATEVMYTGSMTFSADKPGDTINKSVKVK